ncbi:MAG: class C sortase [Clostridiales bacterium]|nr:class C sortase [Clostridiales bacterium]
MKETAKRRRSLKDILATAILALIFLIGVGVLLYPTVSEWWNARVQTRAVATYNALADALSEKDYSEYFEAARAYNNRLYEIGSAEAIASPELAGEDYWDLLDIAGTGVMGYVTIDKIDVQLPIYHGTDAAVLQVGAGHMEGTSLPIGGESTHSVISAHTGLPSALLFTHLDRLTEGDIFTVTILKEVFTYQVDQILVVLPTEIENLYIEDECDYCTLMTCTPYGVNSHRLLVRGSRIYPRDDDGDVGETAPVTGEAEQERQALPAWAKWAALGIGVLLLIYLISDILVRIIRHRRKRRKDRSEPDKDAN